MKVVTAEEMRQIDRAASKIGIGTDFLMENAGRVVAEETRRFVGGVIGRQILVIVGPGNNGGDGLVVARYLSDWGAEVSLYLCAKRSPDDKNLVLTQQRGIPTMSVEDDKGFMNLDQLLASMDVMIDSVFGTGKSRAVEGLFKQVLSRVRDAGEKRSEVKVVAVDIPSGLDADTGAIDASCPRSDITVTLGYPKPGLYSFPGADKAGEVIIADIGIPPHLAKKIPTELITEEWVRSALPKRPRAANKGTFGKVLVVAGSISYIGAAYLACMGAARVGAGLVTLSTAQSLQPILASKLTEVTYVPLPEVETGIIAPEAASILRESLGEYDVLMMGCGLGQKRPVVEFVEATLFDLPKAGCPAVVLDADVLNILAKVPNWWQKLTQDAILTPHPGEMARLASVSLEEVQGNRLEIARKAAGEWHKVVVLKGAYTIVAAPDGRARISQIANPGLASAGTGDVLAGAIAGLVAQGMPLFDAAACGVYLHGQAGEMVRQEMGDAGMLASDLLPLLPRVIMSLKRG
ncbi:MAG: NAD(P)H-hydrate dehydratase [Chloroflexi bacterium]|nr:NAD(P)H-hydrate dehydratase [Chloroflexota bacterium]MBM3172549.1 NAD(P)H-hydrate dehydratase [Chloroflexota bacterium]MBM3175627.1 NAD(P)H-hydrate dehydratase [Chloroflexota bacterium]MBM4450355.1 NAD(P)H-hydrate dehydratase [Chloroflexota bacterium]